MTIRVTRASRGESPTRRVLWAMLTDPEVLGQVAAAWRPGLLGSRETSLPATWAVEFWRRHGRPPGRDIESSFDAWRLSPDYADDAGQMIGRILQDLFDRFEGQDAPPAAVVLEDARRLFEANSLQDLNARMSSALEAGDAARAEAERLAYRPVGLGLTDGPVPLLDAEAGWQAMWETASKPLIQFAKGSALDHFFGKFLVVRGFVSFLGKEKGGKSWWLQWLAWEAASQGRKVLYLEIGDSSEPELRERFAPRILGRPLEAGLYRVPTEVEPRGRSTPRAAHREVRFAEPAHPDMLRVMRRRMLKRWGSERLELYCRPTGTVKVAEVDALISARRARGVHDEIVVIDYADILAPENNRLDRRDQIDETWRALRAVSQRHDCLVLTATQARREFYAEWVLKRDAVSEDKRKLAHVTAMFGINQTDGEKELGVTRLNPVAGRRLTFGEETCLFCAGELGFADPAMLTTF